MRATQVEIARRAGLDVSTCNKILNRVEGPVFKKETIKKVFAIARELHYNLERRNKHFYKRRTERLEAILRKIFPASESAESVAQRHGLDLQLSREIKDALYLSKKPRAAI